MRLATVVVAVFALPIVAIAQQGPPARSNSPLVAPKSSMAMAVAGLACTAGAGAGTFAVQSFSWGASNPAPPPGGSGGKVSISSLNVMKKFDACSPALFDAVSNGTLFTQVTLTQRNTDGDPVMTVVLENARMESWQLSSSTAEAGPTESLSVAAQKFCVTDVPSGNKFCYDLLTGKVS